MAREYGYATTAQNPINFTGPGGGDIIELLKKLLASGQGGKDLEGILAGLQSGFGSVNTHIEAPGANRAPNAAPPIDRFGQSSEKRIPIGPAGTLVVNPTAGLGTIGQGIMNALGKNQDAGQPPASIKERDQLMRMIMQMRKKDKSLSQWNNVLGRI